MFSRPSNRRKTVSTEINLNLVPILDTMVTLISFLLFSSAFLAIVVLDSPAPLLGPPEAQIEKIKKDKPPLQLTAYIQETQVLISDWTGSREAHTIPNKPDPKTGELKYDLEKIHQTLIEIKGRHPDETKLILKPDAKVSYEQIILIMDSGRVIEKTDPPFYKTNAQGVNVPETKLFPEVIFGNIMSS